MRRDLMISKLSKIMFLSTSLILASCSPSEPSSQASTEAQITEAEIESADASSQVESSQVTSKQDANADEHVELALDDMLDGLTNNYCLDIAGGNKNVDTSKGLQAHTCYSYQGKLGTDQVFDSSAFGNNILYMPVYDVCVEVSELKAGATVGLAKCKPNSSLQAFTFAGKGSISPQSAPDLCFTADDTTRYGRAKQHQIKNLSIASCSEELSAYQIWRARSTKD